MKNILLLLPPRRGWGWLLGLVLLLAGAAPAWAQYPTSTTPNPLGAGTGLNAPPIVRPDTSTVRKLSKKEKRSQAAADSAKRTERLFGLHLTRPEKAGILALVPGTGQIYNHKYWKLPLVYGMVGGLGYWVSYQVRYYGYYKFANNLRPTSTKTVAQQINDAKDYEISDKDGVRTALAAAVAANPNVTLNGLIFYRRNLDLSILISGLGFGLQILDAVVDAHLHDFDVSDNLSLNWQPVLLPVPGQLVPAPGLGLTLRTK
ncbi:DUF5683 domain-containing protein [Hymenobacter psoromatis]|uniref:DUF5683 domain-containing protein n=1 Tax=Hymenobacter psoromatis TaxID=1484116 RepID=UPI001CC15607|nr:DUF5683 domain-containing protein [Hymenobacter psoromatis]